MISNLESEAIEIIREGLATASRPVLLYSMGKDSSVLLHLVRKAFWRYIAREEIPVVPLYFASVRPVVRRDGQWIMVDDERMPLQPGETPDQRRLRFRTLGCYPLTAAVESDADTLDAILAETLATHDSERQGRLVNHDGEASMERKRRATSEDQRN